MAVGQRRWDKHEVEMLRSRYGSVQCAYLAKQLRRSRASVYEKAKQLGLQESKGFDYEETLRSMHAAGATDAEIGRAVGRSYVNILRHRVALGLPSNKDSYLVRSRGIWRNKAKLAEMGFSSLAELRRDAHQKYAIRNGWPSDLAPRQVQILNALLEQGPLTRRQICGAIGIEFRGSKNGLNSGGRGRKGYAQYSYLAELQSRGLIVRLGRVPEAGSPRRGKAVHLYSLALAVEPLPVAERMLA